MLSWEEKANIKSLLANTVVLMCKNGLVPKIQGEFCVEGLIGISLGKQDLMLVSINETLQGDCLSESVCDDQYTGSQQEDQYTETQQEDQYTPTPRKRQKRSHSDDTDDYSTYSDADDTVSDTGAANNPSYDPDYNPEAEQHTTPSTRHSPRSATKSQASGNRGSLSGNSKKKTVGRKSSIVVLGDDGIMADTSQIDSSYKDTSMADVDSSYKDASTADVDNDEELDIKPSLFMSTETGESDNQTPRVILPLTDIHNEDDMPADDGTISSALYESSSVIEVKQEPGESPQVVGLVHNKAAAGSEITEVVEVGSNVKSETSAAVKSPEQTAKTADVKSPQQTAKKTAAVKSEQQTAKSELDSDRQQIQCPQCAFKTSAQQYLTIHIKRCHSADKPFKCAVCASAFALKCDLESHAKIHSTAQLTCHICGKGFRSKYGLKNHCITVHKEKTKFQCDVEGCGKSFIRNDSYQDHMNQHRKIRGHSCHICHKAFVTKQMWLKHTNRCKQKQAAAAGGSVAEFRCSLCPSKFLTSADLRQHQQKHEGRYHRCVVCQKEFRFQSSLSRHAKTCAGNK